MKALWYNSEEQRRLDVRNDIVLCVMRSGKPVPSHFRLSEFEDCRGFVMLDGRVVDALERVREDLVRAEEKEVEIVVTDCTRTTEDNERLGARHGWTSEGGRVARDSRHLDKYGGIAVDFVSRYRDGETWVYLSGAVVGAVARRYFSFVKDDYSDPHVHCDMR